MKFQKLKNFGWKFKKIYIFANQMSYSHFFSFSFLSKKFCFTFLGKKFSSGFPFIKFFSEFSFYMQWIPLIWQKIFCLILCHTKKWLSSAKQTKIWKKKLENIFLEKQILNFPNIYSRPKTHILPKYQSFSKILNFDIRFAPNWATLRLGFVGRPLTNSSICVQDRMKMFCERIEYICDLAEKSFWPDYYTGRNCKSVKKKG
jgi:hypothetical protein